ncbi:MAG: hypothetical protein HYU76_14700 [Betaproteobacteria bacterium]|nr:hypothetical protein [Betaproteobacteria bacterium]
MRQTTENSQRKGREGFDILESLAPWRRYARDEGGRMRDEGLRIYRFIGVHRRLSAAKWNQAEGRRVSWGFEKRACARLSRRTPDAMQRGGTGEGRRIFELNPRLSAFICGSIGLSWRLGG